MLSLMSGKVDGAAHESSRGLKDLLAVDGMGHQGNIFHGLNIMHTHNPGTGYYGMGYGGCGAEQRSAAASRCNVLPIKDLREVPTSSG
jgi:hypothetical protein